MMYNYTLGQAWCKLLFKAMSVPFLLLLTVLIVSQTTTAISNIGTEPAGDPSELVGEVLF